MDIPIISINLRSSTVKSVPQTMPEALRRS